MARRPSAGKVARALREMEVPERFVEPQTLPRKMGRPTGYSSQLGREICERLVIPQSLIKICQAEDMPSLSMVYRWLGEFPEFREQYARAREIQAHVAADLAFDESMSATDKDDAPAAKVRAEGCRWHAGKLLPKVYGEQMQVVHEVGDRLAERLGAARGREKTIEGRVAA